MNLSPVVGRDTGRLEDLVHDAADPEINAETLQGGVPPLIVVAGPEEFLRREAVESIRDAAGVEASDVDFLSLAWAINF